MAEMDNSSGQRLALLVDYQPPDDSRLRLRFLCAGPKTNRQDYNGEEL
jgi:hypothetical protein